MEFSWKYKKISGIHKSRFWVKMLVGLCIRFVFVWLEQSLEQTTPQGPVYRRRHCENQLPGFPCFFSTFTILLWHRFIGPGQPFPRRGPQPSEKGFGLFVKVSLFFLEQSYFVVCLFSSHHLSSHYYFLLHFVHLPLRRALMCGWLWSTTRRQPLSSYASLASRDLDNDDDGWLLW